MSNFTKITPKEVGGNPIVLFDEGWALLTGGNKDDFNPMTISWGTMGELWGQPVCTVFVRPARHTYKYTEANDRFTVSFFEKGQHRAELGVLGSKSGRDIDKMHDSGLTPIEIDGLMAFDEAHTVLVLEKIYVQQFGGKLIDPEIRKKAYGDATDDELHVQYICKIVSAYTKK